MNKYIKSYFQRGLAFSGLGPIICGIIFLILNYTIDGFKLNGVEVCLAIISTYILAFVQAGASVFNQIESWSIPKSLICHLGSIYLAYLLCYLVNRWIPFDIVVIIVFTLIFLVTYFIIWFIVYLCVRKVTKKLNKKLEHKK